MFNPNFSSLTASDSDSIIQAIKSSLVKYTSSTFPYGFMSLAKDFNLSLDNHVIHIAFVFPFHCIGEWDVITNTLESALSSINGENQYSVRFTVTADVHAVRNHSINNIKNIVAVSSGKGGVGKSTTAVNLAYALIAEGATVGILDADIYGPSIPTLLNLKDAKPNAAGPEGKGIAPLMADNLAAMSIGFLTDANDATIWRGPMASRAFSQILNETHWPELDYLLIDMPPGTGDIQLTLAQQVPVAASVIVTTPQDIALVDAIKGISMFEKVSVPVLGIIENMSYHVCENCGHHSHIFGEKGGSDIADIYETPLLGQLPLNIEICQDADLGRSIVLQNSTSDISQQYRKIARKLTAELFNQLDMRSPKTADISYNANTNNTEETS